MTHERIASRLLAEVPDDEAQHVARPLPASVAEARARVGRAAAPRPMLMAAAAALVALGIVVGWAAWRASSDATPVGSGEVPTETPSPSASARVGGCRATDFALASDPWDAGAGSRGTRIVFRVVASTARCNVGGQLSARITDADDAILVEGGSPAIAAVEFPSGSQWEIGVSWSNWCGPAPAEPIALSVRLPGDDAWSTVAPSDGSAIIVPPCMGLGQSTALNVTGLERSERPPIGN